MWIPDRVEYIIVSFGKLGVCCDAKSTSKNRRTKKISIHTQFLWGEEPSQPQSLPHPPSLSECVLAFGTSVGAVAIANNPVAAVAAACIPIMIPVNNTLAGVPISEAVRKSISHFQLVNSTQLSFGLVEFLTGDIVNGFVHMMMAGAGFYVTRIEGIALLPSYSVASTLFAGVSTLNLIEALLGSGTISASLPMTQNFIRLGTIAHPFLYIISAYYAWSLIEQLRSGLLTDANPMQTREDALVNPIGSGIPPNTLFEPTNQSNRPPFVGRGFRLNSTATLDQA